MLNYGIRYECTPFSPAGADYPPPPAPQPRLSGSSLQPHPPAPVLHNPGSSCSRSRPRQVLGDPVSGPSVLADPKHRILGDFLSLPGKHPTPRPIPAQIPKYRILRDFLSLPGKHASTSPLPRAKKPPKPVENLRAGPVLDCAEIHIRGSKTALFDPFGGDSAPFPHQKGSKHPPSIEKMGSVQEKGLWKSLHRLPLRLPLSRHIPSSSQPCRPGNALSSPCGTNCLAGNEIDGIRLSMDHLGYPLKRVSYLTEKAGLIRP